MALLNKDFIKWVIISFVLASPIAWYAMNQWLQNFAYKTTLDWWIFALAGVLAFNSNTNSELPELESCYTESCRSTPV